MEQQRNLDMQGWFCGIKQAMFWSVSDSYLGYPVSVWFQSRTYLKEMLSVSFFGSKGAEWNNRACCVAAIAGVTIQVPCPVVKSLQLIWRYGTRRFHLRVPYHQMSCIDSRWLIWKLGTHRFHLRMPNFLMSCNDLWIEHLESSPINGHQGNCHALLSPWFIPQV